MGNVGAQLPLIEWLNLDQTQISDAGITHLTSFTNLRWLSIRETRVTSAGINFLTDALPDITVSQNFVSTRGHSRGV